MKKDNMLNESTIRRFMKLATIDGLSDKFVAENLEEASEEELEERSQPKRDETCVKADEEELEERAKANPEDEEKKMEEGADEELEEMGEMPMKLVTTKWKWTWKWEHEEEPAAGGMVSVDQLMSALERALEDVLGQEVEVSQDDEEENGHGR